MNFYQMSENKDYYFKIANRGYGITYNTINKLLLELNFNVSSIGFRYWISALIEYKRNYWKYNNTIEGIYNNIAEQYQTTRNRVERAMRTARTPADKKIQELSGYSNKITNKIALELLTHNSRILFENINNHIPRID